MLKTTKAAATLYGTANTHLVWMTKYRYPVLVGDVGLQARELLREIFRIREMTIYAGAIDRDHVNLLVSMPSQVSVSRAVQFLKGKSLHRLLSEFTAFEGGIVSSVCGERLLGGVELERDWRDLAEIHRGSLLSKLAGIRRTDCGFSRVI